MSFWALFFFPLCGITQNFSFVSGDLIEKTIALNAFETGQSNILNESESSVVFDWEMITFEQPETWVFSICDYFICYTAGETNGTMSEVDAGSAYAFLGVNVEADVIGIGTYQFVVWDQALPDHKDTLTIILTADGSAGLSETHTTDQLTASSVVYSDRLLISNRSDEIATYTLFNCAGQIILSGNIGPDAQISIATQTFNHGLYLVRFENRRRLMKTIRVLI
jgi:hypothetical protein